MATDRFLIGYTDNNSGIQTNVKPWLLADNAFSNLENCYVFRGRVRKRFGSIWMGDTQLNSRLRYQVATTDGSGASSGTVPGAVFGIGQMFSIGDDVYTVNVPGTPATLLSTNASASMTYDTTTGDFTSTGATATTVVYFYPATPVMGIVQYFLPSIKDYATIAFDTQFSYIFEEMTSSWEAITSGDSTWTGTDSDFFWSINYQGSDPSLNYLWTTNFNNADGIKYFDGTTWTTASFEYDSAGDLITSALLIIQFQNRLLLLNTVEQISSVNTNFFNRVRYSALGDPLAADAWKQDVPGNGSAIDAPVQEEIVTAQFIKNRLIVYFTASTFELVYTGNQVEPFVWQRINTELGAESTFSEIPFDRQVLGVDNIGIHACNGSNVERIDESIPQYSFGFSSVEDGLERIVGIRDYYTELAYWTYPNQVRNDSFYFPNKMLIYNYVNNSWATNDDSITTFGYFLFQEQTPGATWGNTYTPWNEITDLWNSQADSQTNTKAKCVIAGNQQGYIVILRPEINSNAPALQITDVTSSSLGSLSLLCINHNLVINDYVMLSEMNGLIFTDSNGNVLPTVIAQVNSDTFNSDTPNNFTCILLDNMLRQVTISGIYTGGGVASRVSEIDITTKQYNFYTGQDRNVYVSKIDFLVDRTNIGQVTVNFFVSSSQSDLLSGSLNNGSLLGNNSLETSAYTLVPFENTQTRLWHPLYFYAEGECVQLEINMTPTQIFNYVVDTNGNIEYTTLQDFQLNAMVIYAQPTSTRMQ